MPATAIFSHRERQAYLVARWICSCHYDFIFLNSTNHRSPSVHTHSPAERSRARRGTRSAGCHAACPRLPGPWGQSGKRPPCPSRPPGAGARLAGAPWKRTETGSSTGNGAGHKAQRRPSEEVLPGAGCWRSAHTGNLGCRGSGPWKAISRNAKSFLVCHDWKLFPTFCSQALKILHLFAFKTKQPSKKERTSKLTNCRSQEQHSLLT